MMGVVLGLTGQIASGKSTLAKGLATALGCDRVSFGEHVRKTAEELRVEPDRRTLQELGQGLLRDRGAEQFCIDLLTAQAKTFAPGGDLIVDGVRHDTVADALASLVYPSIFLLVSLRVDERTRKRRLELREGEDQDQIHEADRHETELDVTRVLQRRVALTLVSTRPSGELVRAVCEWLARERAQFEGGT